MSSSIVFIIDQQLNVHGHFDDLKTIYPDYLKKNTCSLQDFFSAEQDSNLKKAINEYSVACTSIPGSLTALRHSTPAKLFLHCINDSESALYECVLIYDKVIDHSIPPEILSSLFKHNPLPIYCFDTNGRFIHVNQKLIEFIGVPEQELLTRPFNDFIHPNDLEKAQTQFDLALEGIPSQYELKVLIKNGVQKSIRVNKFPRYQNRKITGVYGIFEDISDKIELESRWQELVEQSPLPVSVFVDGRYVFTNPAALPFYGVDSVEELIGRSVYEFIPDDEVEFLKSRQNRLENNQVIEPGQSRIITKNGDIRHIIAHSRPIIYQGKQAIQSVIFDVTELKEQKEIIEKSLKEKETLLKEIHHRVKNNLAIISGLLELQIKKLDDPNTIEVLKDSQNRILSIALVHQKLYQVDTLDEVNVGFYVEELISTLKKSFQQSDNLSIKIQAQDVFLDIEQAVPCSLIINEVVVNAIKHGFNETDKGKIDIFINKNNTSVQIKVEDNGKGLPEDIDFEQAESLGITLIKILSQQLEGTYLFDELPNGGTRFILRFPFAKL